MATQTIPTLRQPARALSQPRVAYMMSRFPKLTETFILYEMIAVQEQGIPVIPYPLWREHTAVNHPEAESWTRKARFQPFISRPILQTHLHFMHSKPRTYFDTWRTLLRANWGSARYFAGALALFPKAVFFAQQMVADQITHIHAHFASHPAAAAFVIHRLTGIPYSFTAHGSDLHRDQHMLCEKVAEAAFVIAISEYNKNLILQVCGPTFRDKIHVIHCGVDTSVFHPLPESHPRAPVGREDPPPITPNGTKPFTILCIGTLHEVKGQTYLIEACRQLQQHPLPFTCQLVGAGPDRKRLARQIESAGLQQHVHLLGPRPRSEIIPLLQQANVLVAPSIPTASGRREGIPVVLMEAQACGLPVIASDLSGIPELVQHEVNGLLVPPRDVDSLARALIRLANDPALRRRLGLAGRARILESFDLHKNVAQRAQLYTQEVFA